jgi:hypothetical protein
VHVSRAHKSNCLGAFLLLPAEPLPCWPVHIIKIIRQPILIKDCKIVPGERGNLMWHCSLLLWSQSKTWLWKPTVFNDLYSKTSLQSYWSQTLLRLSDVREYMHGVRELIDNIHAQRNCPSLYVVIPLNKGSVYKIWGSQGGGPVFWHRTPYIPFKVNRCLGETYLLHLEGWRVSEERHQHETGSRKEKQLLTFKGLYSVISQKTEPFKRSFSLHGLFLRRISCRSIVYFLVHFQ